MRPTGERQKVTVAMVKQRTSRGFSLLELMVVVMIILVLSIVAVPSVIRGVAAIRLRTAASSVSGLMQEARMLAVRDNATYSIATATTAGVTVVFVDLDRDGTLDDNERVNLVQLPQNVTMVATGAPGITGIGGISNYSPTAALPSFNARGLPCSGTSPCTNGAFIYYLRQTRALDGDAYGAVTITQAGRIKAFTHSGSTWN